MFIDNASEYAEYKRKLQRWTRITNEAKKDQAEVVLYYMEDHASGMQSKIDFALGDSIIGKEDGMEKLITYLDGIYAEDEMTEALTRYKEFTRLVKQDNQSTTEFIAEYDKAHTRAKSSGCEFSDTVLAFNLLEACQLSSTNEKFVLTAIDFKSGKEKKDLFTQVKNSLRKFHGRDNSTDEGSDRIVVKREKAMITEVKQALVAEGWRPPAGSKSNSGSNYQGKKNYLIKGKPARCHHCDSEYHLIGKCPEKEKERKMKMEEEKDEDKKQVRFSNMKGKRIAERTMLSDLLGEDTEFGMVCQVFDESEHDESLNADVNTQSEKVVPRPDVILVSKQEMVRKSEEKSIEDEIGHEGEIEIDIPIEEVVFVEKNETELCCLIEEAGCRGVLDSACSKSVAGVQWIDNYLQNFSESFVGKLELCPSTKIYQFGGGEKRKSKGCIKLPTVIGDKLVHLWLEIVEAAIPLLIGSNSMETAEAVLSFKDMISTF